MPVPIDARGPPVSIIPVSRKNSHDRYSLSSGTDTSALPVRIHSLPIGSFFSGLRIGVFGLYCLPRGLTPRYRKPRSEVLPPA